MARITIGDDVQIGSNVRLGDGVCPGVTIDDVAAIGAGSFVTCDVPPGLLAVGNPAHVLRSA